MLWTGSIYSLSLPIPSLYSSTACACILEWARRSAHSICPHWWDHGWADREKVRTRKGATLCQWSLLAFNSCCVEIQRDQSASEVQIVFWCNSTYTELGFKYHSFGFKYDWTNIFCLLITTMTGASSWGKSCKTTNAIPKCNTNDFYIYIYFYFSEYSWMFMKPIHISPSLWEK